MRLSLRVQAITTLAFCAFISTVQPSDAIDCTKATDQIGQAICGNMDLRKQDDRLTKIYHDTFSLLDYDKQQTLLGAERGWLGRRAETCKSKTGGELTACIRDNTDQQISWLLDFSTTSSSGLHKGVTMKVGGAVLAIQGSPTGDQDDITYQNKTIASAAPSIGFSVEARWQSSAREGVVLSAPDGGTLGCASFYLIVAEHDGRLTTTNLGDYCSADSTHVQRTEDGLAVTKAAQPLAPGLEIAWHGVTGSVAKKNLAFAPRPGSRMKDLAGIQGNEAFQAQEPLDNEEFYHAVVKQTRQDRNRFLAALSHMSYLSWDTSSKNNLDAAAENHSDYLLYQGCSQFAEGALLSCGEEEAIAIWDKQSDKFFFAVRKHRAEDNDAHLVAYPDRAAWPTNYQDMLDAWSQQ